MSRYPAPITTQPSPSSAADVQDLQDQVLKLLGLTNKDCVSELQLTLKAGVFPVVELKHLVGWDQASGEFSTHDTKFEVHLYTPAPEPKAQEGQSPAPIFHHQV